MRGGERRDQENGFGGDREEAAVELRPLVEEEEEEEKEALALSQFLFAECERKEANGRRRQR